MNGASHSYVCDVICVSQVSYALCNEWHASHEIAHGVFAA